MVYALPRVLAMLVIAGCSAIIVRKRDIFHPLAFQAALVVIVIGARVFWVIGNHSELLLDPSSELLTETIVFYAGFFLAAGIFYHWAPIVFPAIRRGRFEIWPFWRKPQCRPFMFAPHALYGVVSIGIILSMTGGVFGFFDNITASRSLYEGRWILAYGLFSLAISAIIVYVQRKVGHRWTLQKTLFLALLALSICGAMLTGFRGMVIQLFIHYIVLVRLTSKKQPYLLLVFYFVFALIAVQVMTQLLFGDLHTLGLSGLQGGVVLSRSGLVDVLLGPVYGRYYTFEATARVLQHLQEGVVQFDDGRFIKLFPMTLLPSAIVGPKPSVTQEMCNAFFSDYYQSGQTSCVTSAPAFMYWQMGWLGYALAAFAYGTFMRFWVRIYETAGEGNVLFTAITYPYFMMTFVGHIGTVAEFVYMLALVSPVLCFKIAPKPGAASI